MIETLDVSENEYLIHFSCNYNRLKELDVSNNLFITLLSVVDNMLTGIDVSNNSWLRYFYCDFNSLTELDISANTRLVFLSCDYNKLPELNLSNNPNLKAMTCTGNMLANLDISKCPELGILGCQYNYIKSIDDVIGWRLNYYLVPDRTFLFSPQFVGKPPVGLEVTPFFTDPNFLAAVREITAIPEGPIYDYNVHFIMDLNLASKNIADLSGIEYFVNLTRLECQDNQLKTLDISKNMALSYLNCSYNNMETTADVKGWEELGLRQNISFIFSPQNGQHLVETPRITKQPESITVGKDGVATLAVEAEVTYGILTYQWYEQSGIPFVPITGATDSSYNVPTNIAGIKRYRCTITNTDETAAVYKTAVTSTNGATVTVTNESPVSFNVTGLVKSYNPKNPTTLLLFKGEEAQAAYATTIPGVNGSGQQVQDFTFPDVEPGTYKLVITKDVHTRFTVKNVVVDNKDLDLTLDDRPEVQLITLRCGDINSDGLINDADLTILWRAGNYNNRAARAENPLADLNNDGLINDADLTILWMAYNYNRGEIVIDW
jgi:Leucine-rich repeat (LRR) protein